MLGETPLTSQIREHSHGGIYIRLAIHNFAVVRTSRQLLLLFKRKVVNPSLPLPIFGKR